METGHPTLAQLEQLAQGTLGEPEATEIRSHLAACANCLKLYDECLADEKLASDLRDAVEPSTKVLPSDGNDSTHGNQVYPVTDGSIPGYRLLRVIDSGGQGIVYQAVQEQTKRKVAIKVLKAGPHASDSARRRFEREIELVARLKHPSIVSIFHSGETAGGQQFCVMDYIRGLSLLQYVRQKGPPLEQALSLFCAVCEAVSYAHQRGVIHRDLKPENILVTHEGTPRILDFGLAKSLSSPEETIVSVTGEAAGTPKYMAPEQLRGNPDEIDTRTDVYALGVVLYELLTGHLPYPETSSPAETYKHIAETSPTPPRRRWSRESGIAERSSRRFRVGECPIDGELQTIVLRCLAKDRERRYQSAGELARDIRHYLNGEPIEAKRDSVSYVIWKAIGRHRRPVAASALGLALLVCAVVSAWRVRVQAARIDMAKSERIEVMFGYDPAGALTEFSLAHNTVVGLVAEQASRDVASPSFARRIVGARSAAWTNQEAFWESVGANDANSLWRNGEWLELAEVDWPEPVALIDQLKRKAAGGTDKEKYVAFCLIGQLAVADPTVAELCKQAAREESNTGVAAAAWWAARQLDPNVPFPSSQVIQRDDVSGLAFVKIPACKAFRRGSPPTEKDRYEDEAMQQGKPIPTFYLSMTEVTARAFGQFWDDQRTDEWVESKGRGDRARTEVMNELCNQMKRIGSDEAVAWVSLEIAHQFCEWLTAAAKNRNMRPSRRYCVPSEDQWEYACRAGNPGRFCFGNNATYATYFANCGGYNPNALVAQRMPNFYGLFDMHGGLWEWCRTPYPADLVEDPGISPEQKENLYVFRGGAYYSPAIRCRSAQRNRGEPHGADGYRGFRIVMEYLSK